MLSFSLLKASSGRRSGAGVIVTPSVPVWSHLNSKWNQIATLLPFTPATRVNKWLTLVTKWNLDIAVYIGAPIPEPYMPQNITTESGGSIVDDQSNTTDWGV